MASKFLVSSIISLSLVFVGKTFAEWLIVAYKTSKASKKSLLKIRDSHSVATMDDIPGLAGYPLVGSIFDMIPYLQRYRIDEFFFDLNAKFGSLVRIKFVGMNSLIVSDAAIAKKIANLPDNFHRGTVFRDIMFDVAPHALFVIPSGEQWKKHRKGLQPAFGPIHLREVFTISLNSADKLLEIWSRSVTSGSNTRDLNYDFSMLTTDVIGMAGFSVDLGSVKSLEEKRHIGFHEQSEKISSTLSKV
ncbi:hypothetical protein HK096_001285 [Nowakowskiella sp. JEL0078]|nr:hypothetical protein HK096_001285 [Nowakowskiella sp. JEL0078]